MTSTALRRYVRAIETTGVTSGVQLLTRINTIKIGTPSRVGRRFRQLCRLYGPREPLLVSPFEGACSLAPAVLDRFRAWRLLGPKGVCPGAICSLYDAAGQRALDVLCEEYADDVLARPRWSSVSRAPSAWPHVAEEYAS